MTPSTHVIPLSPKSPRTALSCAEGRRQTRENVSSRPEGKNTENGGIQQDNGPRLLVNTDLNPPKVSFVCASAPRLLEERRLHPSSLVPPSRGDPPWSASTALQTLSIMAFKSPSPPHLPHRRGRRAGIALGLIAGIGLLVLASAFRLEPGEPRSTSSSPLLSSGAPPLSNSLAA